MAKNAVAKKETAGLPAGMMEKMGQYAGAGSEESGAEDMMIPFLYIVQANSKVAKRSEGAYIEGAQEGMFLNSATNELFSGEDGITIIPVFYRRTYTEWVPYDAGGGFVGEHTDASILEQTHRDEKTGKDVLANGNEIVTSGEWYVLLVDEATGDVQQAVISMSGTQMKKSRRLMTILKQVTFKGGDGKAQVAPLFYSTIKLTTVPESNDHGSWMGYAIGDRGVITDLPNGEELFDIAANMWEGLKAGSLRAAPPPAPDGSGTADDLNGDPEDDIPFG